MYIFKEINICAKIQLIWIKYTNIRYQKYVIFAQIMLKAHSLQNFAYNIFNDINQQSAFGYLYCQ